MTELPSKGKGKVEVEEEEASGATDEKAPEEEADVQFQPVVKLDEIKVKTHEEDEDVLYKIRAKLFRFDKPTSQWKERGTGEVKFLKHKQSKKIRLLMRQEKTLKVCANHAILPSLKLDANVGSDRSWVWTANDFADEELKQELFAIRFLNSETAAKFKEQFESYQKEMKELLASEEKK